MKLEIRQAILKLNKVFTNHLIKVQDAKHNPSAIQEILDSNRELIMVNS
jgi:hypothetical protein